MGRTELLMRLAGDVIVTGRVGGRHEKQGGYNTSCSGGKFGEIWEFPVSVICIRKGQ